MFTVFIYFMGILLFTKADRDLVVFDYDTCVKIFYAEDHVYHIYCLIELDDKGTMGFITDRNHTIIFKKTTDIEVCVDVLTETNAEKHCIDAIPYNCVSQQEDIKKDFNKNETETTPCHKLNLEEAQLSCMGIKHQEFTLVAYCREFFYYSRRTVLYFPNNKPPERQ